MIPFVPADNGYRAVLFDLDGTLIDTLPALTSSLNAVLSEDGLRRLKPEEVRLLVGDGIKVLMARVLAAVGVPPPDDGTLMAALARFSAHYDADPGAGCAPFPHAAEILGALMGLGYGLGVVTNKPEAPARELLTRYALAPALGAVVGGDTTDHLKPHPEPMLFAADLLGVAPQNTVMVGDSINDVTAARRAGMRVIAVSYGYSRISAAEMGADAVIDRLADLPRAIAALPAVAAP